MRIALVLLLAGLRLTLAADAEAWKSQILYFLITDRFAQSPGVNPAGPCKLTGWNNGTWSGITDKLDYIKDMGMTAIWITPIPKQIEGEYFGETGYHGYWAEDWSKIDPHFGTEKDLKDLLAAAKKKGVMTMLDVVGNHVGPVGTNYSGIHPFNKTEHYHSCIEGCDQWCSIPQAAYDSKPQNYTLITTCRLQGLPDLNQSVPFVKEQLMQWLDDTMTKFDFDGLRVDTVKHVEPEFWRNYTATGKRFTLGEVLNGDTATLIKYVQGPQPAMHSVLNFPMYYALNNVFVRKQDMTQLASERARQYELLGGQVVSTMGNFVDNHDVPRFLTQQPDEQLLRNALTWVLLADGIPTIYYGTGAGFTGDVQQGNNRGCLWELGYNESQPLYQTISKLAKFRTANKLWQQPEQVLTATPDCFVFSRGPNVLTVTTNAGSGKSVTCSVELPANSTLLTGGVSALRDVLAPAKPAVAYLQGHDIGLVWYPASRKLTIAMPDGAPRVLTNAATKIPASPQQLACDSSTEQCSTSNAAAAAAAATPKDAAAPVQSAAGALAAAKSLFLAVLALLAALLLA